VIDECSEMLFCETERDNAQLFHTAEGEALDFLVAEAYLTFERTNLSIAARQKKNIDTAFAMKATNSMRRRSSLFKSPDQETLVAMMNKILNDPEYLTVFKIYMLGADAECLLYAYIEAVEIHEKLTLLSSELEEDVRLQIFFHYVNAYYDTYLALGAPFRVQLLDATYGDFMRRLNKQKSPQADALKPIVDECFENLVREYLDRFLSTAEYRQLMRSGRNSVSCLADRLKKPIVTTAAEDEERLRRESRARDKQRDEATGGSGSAMRRMDGAAAAAAVPAHDEGAWDEADNGPFNEIRSFMMSSYNGIFGSYLETHDKLPLMNFFQSASRFSSATFRHDMERIADCTSIFDRYISRNSDEQIGLPDGLRLEIVRQLFRSPLTIYTAAASYVAHVLLGFWLDFKEQVLNGQPAGPPVDQPRLQQPQHSQLLKLQEAESPKEDKKPATRNNRDSDSESSSSAVGDIDAENQQLVEKSATPKQQPLKRERPKTTSGDDEFDEAVPVVVRKKSLTTDDLPEFARLAASRFPQQQLQSHLSQVPPGSSEFVRLSSRRRSSTIGGMRRLLMGGKGEGGVEVGDRRSSSATLGLGQGAVRKDFEGSDEDRPLTTRSLRRFSLDKSSERENSGSSRPLRRRNSLGVPHIVDSTAPISALHSLQQPSLRRLESSLSPAGRGSSKMIRDVLQHPQCCGIFKDFLDRESAPQTLLFLLDVEEFKRIPNATFQRLRARKIFNKFIHESAVFPVPVSETTRATVSAELDCASFGVFKHATEEVMHYIEEFQFPQFARSPDAKQVEAVLRNEGMAVKQKRRQSITIDTLAIADTRSLRQILLHQTTTRFFKDFCNRTYVTESLFFWLDAEHYANLPGSDYMKRTAYKICRKFIFDRARMPINISYQTRTEILKGLSDPQRTLFRRAQDEIYKLLEQDAIPKFIHGPEYKAMLQAVESSQVAGRARSPVEALSKALSAFGLV